MSNENRLEASIARRTGGRVRDLRVEILDGRVLVRGRSPSYHVKQLALAAVLESFEGSESRSERVELDIEVGPVDNRQSPQWALSDASNLYYSDEFDLAREM